MGFVDLDVGAEFKVAMLEVVDALTRDNGAGAERVRDTIASGEAV